jgi:hypothetical protein
LITRRPPCLLPSRSCIDRFSADLASAAHRRCDRLFRAGMPCAALPGGILLQGPSAFGRVPAIAMIGERFVARPGRKPYGQPLALRIATPMTNESLAVPPSCIRTLRHGAACSGDTRPPADRGAGATIHRRRNIG